ncbi:unnamed protein product [Auanema sp. JU1783]|nr:unnamed protein product [Auanema sp. JU1783]
MTRPPGRSGQTLALLLLTSLIQLGFAQFDSTACGRNKGCLFQPNGCDPGSNCQTSFSYTIDGDSMDMEIAGLAGDNSYVAIGFSDDSGMGDDTVVFCGQMNGGAVSGLGYNRGKSNIVLDIPGVQEVIRTQAANGNVYCRIKQKLNPGESNVKNLNGQFYILSARGPMSMQDSRPVLQYHSTKFISPSTNLRVYTTGGVDQSQALNDSGNAPKTKVQKLKMAHGILMLLAWTVFFTTGILFARHFRDHWPKGVFLGVKMWFNLHRTLNMVGIAATICGFVCIFVANDWVWTGPKATQTKEQNQQWGSIHSILGLLACVVAWAQPLNAVFRCNPDAKARFIFNWIHRFLGAGAWLMAAAAIMIACVHFKGMFSNRDAALGIYIAFIAAVGVTLILLELLKFKSWYSNRGRVGAEMEMVRMGGAHGRSEVVTIDPKIQKIQSLIMLLCTLIAIGAGVAISILIGLS